MNMKRIGSLLVVLFLLMTGCGDSKQSAEDLITVDVTASYPKKELILQDFMDVEYIALETNDEFVNQGFVQAIGKKYILFKRHCYFPDNTPILFGYQNKSFLLIIFIITNQMIFVIIDYIRIKPILSLFSVIQASFKTPV